MNGNGEVLTYYQKLEECYDRLAEVLGPAMRQIRMRSRSWRPRAKK